MTRGATNGLIGLCALIVTELALLLVMTEAPTVTRGDPGPWRGVPPELAVAAQRLGIPESELTRLQVRWGLPDGLRQPRAGYIGAAYHEGHIYIRKTKRPVDPLAYEYLHAVWADLAPQPRARLIVLLNQFDVANADELEPDLTELVETDVQNGAAPGSARFDELHSIACSRTSDSRLQPDLRAYCDDVLPGRAITTKVY